LTADAVYRNQQVNLDQIETINRLDSVKAIRKVTLEEGDTNDANNQSFD
jgi:hypothetical protein